MHRLIQQKIVDHFREGEDVWFNRTDTTRSRAVPYDDDLCDDLASKGQLEVIAKTKKGLQCGALVDKDGLHFLPDTGRRFRIQWEQVYGLILETHKREQCDEV